MQMTNELLLENVQIVSGFAPVDMSASSGPTSDYVSMKNYRRCLVLLHAGAGTAANDTTVTAVQAKDVSATDAKALTFTRIDTKQGAALTAIAQFTTVTQTAAATYTSATSGEEQLLWAFEIKAEDLDIDGGFDCIQFSVNDHGAAKVGGLLYILYDPRTCVDPMLGAIAD